MKKEYKNLLFVSIILLGAVLLASSCSSQQSKYNHGKNYTGNPRGTSWMH